MFYINYASNEKEVENFFKRAGVLLAIADTLNYSDGHCENLIAHGEYPVLLDGETFFQNYSNRNTMKPEILFTHLLQGVDELKPTSVYSAFQVSAFERMEIFHTHAINDLTDQLKISFKGLTGQRNQNFPFIDNNSYNASNFETQLLDGYCLTYDLISKLN